MKYLTCIGLLLFTIRITAGTRMLVLPFQTENAQDDPWEGLALTLAWHSQTGRRENLIPFTTYRKKLNEYGLSAIAAATLATKIKLARDLAADRIVFGSLEADRLRVSLYDVARAELKEWSLPRGRSWAPDQVLKQLRTDLVMEFAVPPPQQWDFFRVWASTYFAEELETARTMMKTLVEHKLAGWLFIEEYLDLFGDPGNRLSSVREMIYWRDLFLQKSFYSRALKHGDRVLAQRFNPEDLLVQATILAALNEGEQACELLNKAKTYGVLPPETDPLARLCKEDENQSSDGHPVIR